MFILKRKRIILLNLNTINKSEESFFFNKIYFSDENIFKLKRLQLTKMNWTSRNN